MKFATIKQLVSELGDTAELNQFLGLIYPFTSKITTASINAENSTMRLVAQGPDEKFNLWLDTKGWSVQYTARDPIQAPASYTEKELLLYRCFTMFRSWMLPFIHRYERVEVHNNRYDLLTVYGEGKVIGVNKVSDTHLRVSARIKGLLYETPADYGSYTLDLVDNLLRKDKKDILVELFNAMNLERYTDKLLELNFIHVSLLERPWFKFARKGFVYTLGAEGTLTRKPVGRVDTDILAQENMERAMSALFEDVFGRELKAMLNDANVPDIITEMTPDRFICTVVGGWKIVVDKNYNLEMWKQSSKVIQRGYNTAEQVFERIIVSLFLGPENHPFHKIWPFWEGTEAIIKLYRAGIRIDRLTPEYQLSGLVSIIIHSGKNVLMWRPEAWSINDEVTGDLDTVLEYV